MKLCPKCNTEKEDINFTSNHKICRKCMKLPEFKIRKPKPTAQTPKQIKNYINHITHGLTGNDY